MSETTPLFVALGMTGVFSVLPLAAKAQTPSSGCDADKLRYALSIGVSCSAVGDKINLDSSHTQSQSFSDHSEDVGRTITPTRADTTQMASVTFRDISRLVVKTRFAQIEGGRCTKSVWHIGKKLAEAHAYVGENKTEDAQIKANERVFILADGNFIPYITCRNMVSFVPEAGGHYEVTQDLDHRIWPPKFICSMQVIDTETGSSPPTLTLPNPCPF